MRWAIASRKVFSIQAIGWSRRSSASTTHSFASTATSALSGQTSTYRYDGNGNLTASVDPLARTTTRAYDALNRLVTLTDAAGGVTRYTYDAKNRLVSVRDPINLTTTYTYDGLGNLAQLASPDTGISTFVPDAQGNVIGSTDSRGLATSYTYDALNRQTLANHVGASVALEYDNVATGGAYARGRLTKVTDPSGSTSYAYDARGRVVRKTQMVGSGRFGQDVRRQLSIHRRPNDGDHISVGTQP